MGEEGKKITGRKEEGGTFVEKGREKKEGIILGAVDLEAAESLLTQTGSPGNEMIVKEGNRKPLVT